MMETIANTTCKAIVAALPDAALIVDVRSEVVAANANAKDILSAPLEGQPLALYLRSPDVLSALLETLESGTFRQVEFQTRAFLHSVRALLRAC